MTNVSVATSELETQLNSFTRDERAQALKELAARAGSGKTALEAEKEVANMHCHTFYSFNAYGYSPSGLAWLAKKRGFALLGIVDFDVLDAVDEFLDACFTVGVRGSAALETRVFIPEFASRDINSPGEPGVFYYMGVGFTATQPAAEAAPILTDMRQRAEQRNRAMIERINAHLAPVEVDYARDVLPLTPAGNATERHILSAYTSVAERHFADPSDFWAEKLNLSREQVTAQLANLPTFHNTVRSKLMKRGGVGYSQPGAQTFPTLEDVTQMILASQALPCATWLDGMSAGEEDYPELLNLLIGKGVAALNIIPDRNWNIPDPELRRAKVEKLYEVVALARELDLPLNVGTEMNSYGQKLIDDFDAPELAPVRQDFLDGSYFVYGHTLMQRAAGMGYQSEWARTHLPTRRERNAFYTNIGRMLPPTPQTMARLQQYTLATLPADILTAI